jgi:hypothetical protein
VLPLVRPGWEEGKGMEAPRKDWVREVMMPGMRYGAVGGVAFGGLVMWVFSEAFRHWQDYAFFPALGAVFGAMLAWGLTGLAGVIRWLLNR